MPALNFQKQFAEAVESGKKCQTIRAYRKDTRDPKPGDTLYLYYGMRTKQCRKLGEAECKSVDRVIIGPSGICFMGPSFIEPLARTQIGADIAAKEDGFGNFAEMRDWFDKTHGLPFNGLLIRWEPPTS